MIKSRQVFIQLLLSKLAIHNYSCRVLAVHICYICMIWMWTRIFHTPTNLESSFLFPSVTRKASRWRATNKWSYMGGNIPICFITLYKPLIKILYIYIYIKESYVYLIANKTTWRRNKTISYTSMLYTRYFFNSLIVVPFSIRVSFCSSLQN